MNECMFSIVVPVFQAIKYLRPCIESVILQTEQSWELILVDDGSTDGSAEVCDAYANQDSRIKVIHQSNSGPYCARWAGYRNVTGKYLMHLDADDCFYKDTLSSVRTALEESDPDVLIFGFNTIEQDSERILRRVSLTDRMRSNMDYNELVSLLYPRNAFNNLWNKVFRTDYFKNVSVFNDKHSNLITGEDMVMVAPLIIRANQTVVIPRELYQYRLVNTSITHVFKEKKVDDFYQARDVVVELFQKNQIDLYTVYVNTYTGTEGLIATCCRSNMPYADKIRNLKAIREKDIFIESIPAGRRVPRGKGRKLRMFLFENRIYSVLILFEQIFERIKK